MFFYIYDIVLLPIRIVRGIRLIASKLPRTHIDIAVNNVTLINPLSVNLDVSKYVEAYLSSVIGCQEYMQ